MSQPLRVILEVGPKRRVVAGAMDWPGLDRWGTSEDDALRKLATYLPRYADVAQLAGQGSEFAAQTDLDVVERVPGSSSTDFWGIAHVPSQIEREVLSDADLERRLTLLQATWAFFDGVRARITEELLPSGRGGGRDRETVVRHVIKNEPESFSRKVEVRTPQEDDPDPGRPGRPSRGLPRRHPRLQRRGQARPDVAHPVPHPAHRPPRDGPHLGAPGPRSRRLTGFSPRYG